MTFKLFVKLVTTIFWGICPNFDDRKACQKNSATYMYMPYGASAEITLFLRLISAINLDNLKPGKTMQFEVSVKQLCYMYKASLKLNVDEFACNLKLC